MNMIYIGKYKRVKRTRSKLLNTQDFYISKVDTKVHIIVFTQILQENNGKFTEDVDFNIEEKVESITNKHIRDRKRFNYNSL